MADPTIPEDVFDPTADARHRPPAAPPQPDPDVPAPRTVAPDAPAPPDEPVIAPAGEPPRPDDRRT